MVSRNVSYFDSIKNGLQNIINLSNFYFPTQIFFILIIFVVRYDFTPAIILHFPFFFYYRFNFK